MEFNYIVAYKKEHNGKCRLARNQVRNVAHKYFKTIEEARAFAETVEVIRLVNKNTGIDVR